MMKTCITSTKTLVQMYTTYNVHPSSSRGEIHVLRLRISTGVKSLGSERLKETTPDPADPDVGRSLSFHPSIHHLCLLSTNSGVAYSRISDDLVRFRKRQHHPIIPSSTSLCTLLSPSIAFSKEKRHRRSLIQSIHCVASDSTNLRPPLLSRWGQIAFSVCNLQSTLTTQRQFNGYAFNVVLPV